MVGKTELEEVGRRGATGDRTWLLAGWGNERKEVVLSPRFPG